MKEYHGIIYRCDHCKKRYEIKRFAIQHEERCFQNPANNRPCFNCQHLEKKSVDFYFDTFQGGDSRKVEVFFCNKLQNYLQTPQNVFKGNGFLAEDLEGDFENLPMPVKCEFHTLDIMDFINEMFE